MVVLKVSRQMLKYLGLLHSNDEYQSTQNSILIKIYNGLILGLIVFSISTFIAYFLHYIDDIEKVTDVAYPMAIVTLGLAQYGSLILHNKRIRLILNQVQKMVDQSKTKIRNIKNTYLNFKTVFFKNIFRM